MDEEGGKSHRRNNQSWRYHIPWLGDICQRVWVVVPPPFDELLEVIRPPRAERLYTLS
jgi:hypothetical protein